MAFAMSFFYTCIPFNAMWPSYLQLLLDVIGVLVLNKLKGYFQ